MHDIYFVCFSCFFSRCFVQFICNSHRMVIYIEQINTRDPNAYICLVVICLLNRLEIEQRKNDEMRRVLCVLYRYDI